MKRILSYLVLVLAAALPAAGAPGSVNVSLPGLATELSLSFENVTGLDFLSLGISARLANPLDPAFRARLPAGTGIAALPVILRIEPPAWGGLSFRGVASFDIHTHLLPYAPTTPLRIFAAPLGGSFSDITANMGSGSYRARGMKGGFSEFLIAVDLRPVDQVIQTKLDALDGVLEGYEGSMPGSVYDDLEDRLAAVRAHVALGAIEDAIEEVDGFLAVVEQHSGTDIPDVWRAAGDRHNVAGYLESGALTLRFSLVLKDQLGH